MTTTASAIPALAYGVTTRARRMLHILARDRLNNLHRSGYDARYVGAPGPLNTPSYLALANPDGTGHLYPLPDHPGAIPLSEWQEMTRHLTCRPAPRYRIRTTGTHYTAIAPADLAAALLRYAYAHNHGYAPPWSLHAHAHLPGNTLIPLEPVPDPHPAPTAYADHPYPPHEWSLVPPSGRAVLRVRATLSPHL